MLFRSEYSTRPLQFFGLFGFAGLGVGSIIGFVLLFEKVFWAQEIMYQHGPLLFLSVLLILSGIQLLSVGLVGEMVTRTYFESQQKATYAVQEIISQGGREERPKGAGIGVGSFG